MASWDEQLRYPLRPENLACEPSEVRYGQRGLGRLLVVDRARRRRSHSFVADFRQWLDPGDVLVLNNCKRIPGVLRARTPQGAQVELRFTHLDGETGGVCRIYPAHALTDGACLTAGEGTRLRVVESGIPPHGLYRVSLEAGSLRELLKTQGFPITSFFYRGYWSIENYNPCYASEEGSVESPMAGLHFTPEHLEDLARHGVRVVFVTLQPVGSWLPVLESGEGGHFMSREPYFIPPETAAEIAAARQRKNAVTACGTTVVRTLESAARPDGTVAEGPGETELFISPGFEFQVVDHYFTNFHPSSSSLMILDAAFCERELLLDSYREASERGYLFYEFGDAIFYL